MNQITQAFVAAGAKLPKQPSQSERLWRVIKDNPGITGARARDLAKLTDSGTTSLLSQMTDRGMLTVERRPKRVPGLNGFVERNLNHYSVHPRMNGVYERLPAPYNRKVAPKAKPTIKLVKRNHLAENYPELSAVTKVDTRPEPPPADPGINIDTLTLGQARHLYRELHQLFGGR